MSKHNEVYTEDLADFGARERKMAAELPEAWQVAEDAEEVTE